MIEVNQKLSHRLNRVIGQIEAVRKKIEHVEEGGGDAFSKGECLDTIYQLKAARNALKKFAEAYLQMHLDDCLRSGKPPNEIESGLKEAVKAAMDL